MIVYAEYPKELIRKVIVTDNYSNIEEHHVSMPRSVTFLYTSNERVEFDIKKMAVPFTLVTPKICAKYVQAVSEENLKKLC